MAIKLNIGNMTPEGAEALVEMLPVTMAKVVPVRGYWKGVWEDAVELYVYDADACPKTLIEIIGREMPDEEGFGLGEGYAPNPHYGQAVAA